VDRAPGWAAGWGLGLVAGLAAAVVSSGGRGRVVGALTPDLALLLGRSTAVVLGAVVLGAGLAEEVLDEGLVVLESGRGGGTSATEACFAVVCGRRAACAWRVAVDFFAMLFSRVLSFPADDGCLSRNMLSCRTCATLWTAPKYGRSIAYWLGWRKQNRTETG